MKELIAAFVAELSEATVTTSELSLVAVTVKPVMPCAVASNVFVRFVMGSPSLIVNTASFPASNVVPVVSPRAAARPPVSAVTKIPVFPVVSLDRTKRPEAASSEAVTPAAESLICVISDCRLSVAVL